MVQVNNTNFQQPEQVQSHPSLQPLKSHKYYMMPQHKITIKNYDHRPS
jgi:hypothetical protein